MTDGRRESETLEYREGGTSVDPFLAFSIFLESERKQE